MTDAITMVVNHLLTGMILQNPRNSFCFLDVYWDTILNDSVNIGHSDAHVDQ